MEGRRQTAPARRIDVSQAGGECPVEVAGRLADEVLRQRAPER